MRIVQCWYRLKPGRTGAGSLSNSRAAAAACRKIRSVAIVAASFRRPESTPRVRSLSAMRGPAHRHCASAAHYDIVAYYDTSRETTSLFAPRYRS